MTTHSLPKPAPQEFRILSVEEMGGHSDRFVAYQNSYIGGIRHNLRICISVDKTVELECSKDGYKTVSMQFPRLHIPSLIEFLQDAQTFISEEEMIATLVGRR